MRNLYFTYLEKINELDNDKEKLSFLVPLVRSITQLVIFSCFELAKTLPTYEDEEIDQLILRLHKPSDGVPIELLEKIVPFIRTYKNDVFLKGWFEKNDEVSLAEELLEFINFRNNDGHGITDQKLATKWVNKLNKLIPVFFAVANEIIPTKEGYISKYNLILSFPILYKDHPIIIRDIKQKRGIWFLNIVSLSISNSEEYRYTIADDSVLIVHKRELERGYEIIDVNNEIISHNIPKRQTDTFEGRTDELNRISDWYNDDDSRTCLIYGDGGYGKTTLILESLNRLIEGNLSINKYPTFICYYSAKMTKWTENGLVYLKSYPPLIDDCVREIVKTQISLDKSFFSLSGKNLIDKVIGLMREYKINRDDILLIIDNTETLTSNVSSDIAEFSDLIKYISKRLARIILTSRRRELVEATPIVITSFSEIESVSLLKKLAEKYDAKPLCQAGESRLRKISNNLMNKPILIEAFVKYISLSSSSIDDALKKYFTLSNEELLNFLYDDAWLRMNELQRDMFLVIIHIDCEVTGRIINRACQLVKINIDEFTKAYEETHFASITEYGSDFNFEVIELAKRFFINKFSCLDLMRQSKIKTIASEVENYNKHLNYIESNYRKDRVAEAFRSEYAKSAKIYAEKGNIQEAINMYDLAIQDEPTNSYLYDRYAWLLLNKTNKFSCALVLAQKAYKYNEDNVDAIVSIALSYYRLDDLTNGDNYIDLSVKKGRNNSFSFFRKGVARYQLANRITDNRRKMDLYNEAISLFNKAQKHLSTELQGYDAKTRDDIVKYKESTLGKLNKIRL